MIPHQRLPDGFHLGVHHEARPGASGEEKVRQPDFAVQRGGGKRLAGAFGQGEIRNMVKLVQLDD